MSLLIRSSLYYFKRHPMQLFFSILGVALGVAIIVGIDLTSHSARQGFYLSTQSLSGNASHRIINSKQAIPESIYVQLRNELGLEKVTPLIKKMLPLSSSSGNYADNGETEIQLTGIDPFSEAEIRNWQEEVIDGLSGDRFEQFLTQDNTVLVESVYLKQHRLNIGDTISVQIHNRPVELKIIATFEAPEIYQSQIGHWFICDISTAQTLLDFQGYLSQIDVFIDESDDELIKRIESILPESTQLVKTNEYSQSIARLSRSFELNLTALSLLGLLVSMFLIYNTMMFSVVQRRELLARMRIMGVTRKEMFRLILTEALIIAVIACGMGLLLGGALAHILLFFVTRTINDLYYVLQVTQVHWSQFTFYKAIFLGVGATLIAAIIPALEAAYTRPVNVSQRSVLEDKIKHWSHWLVLPGLLGCLVVYLLIKEQVGDMLTGFSLVFIMIISLICLLPFVSQYLLKLLALIMKQFFHLPGKIAVNNISRSFSRSIVAIAALTVSVSAALGIGLMVDSFRFTVDEWLSGYLKADYFINTTDSSASTVEPFTKAIIEELAQIQGIEFISSDQDVRFYKNGEYYELTVLDIPHDSFSAFRLKDGHPASAQKEWLENDAVIVSEPYAYHHQLSVGDSVSLPVQRNGKISEQRFKIVGIYYHYGSEHGVINMNRKTYNRYWQNQRIDTLGIYLTDELVKNQQKRISFEEQLETFIGKHKLNMIARTQLHEQSLVIFDRTFRITNVLKILVILVSFVGILSALMAIEIERSREFAILRATGLTGRQLSTLVFLETGSMGIVAGLIAMPMGIVLAYLLIEVVNYRSFGWSMQFILSGQEFIMSATLALSAAIIAAIYPAWHLRKKRPALALRGE